MNAYRPIAYRQYHLAGRRGLGQTFDEILGFTPELGDVLRLLGHSGGSWLGFHVALSKTAPTVLKAVGWVIGAGMGIAAILDGVSLIKRACGTHP